MSPASRSALCVGLLAAAGLLPPVASALPPRVLAQACLDALDAQHGKGKDAAIAVADGGPACNALLAAVRDPSAGPVGPGLVEALPKAKATALHDYLITLPSVPGAAQSAPDPAALASILAELPDPAAAKPGFWQRVEAWLRRLLDRDDPEARQDGGWLGRLLEALARAIPTSVGKALGWIVFGLLLLVLAVVVIREIRIGRSGRVRPRRERLATAPSPAPATLAETMPDQPAALLRWVIERLVHRGRLPGDPALTNRELSVRLPVEYRGRFSSLVRIAERSLFGGRSPADEERVAAQTDAAALLAEPAPVSP